MSPVGEANAPRISVLIPAYNHERYIEETLNSVLQQTFSDLEVVVVDDGSQDRTGELVKAYAEKDSRVRYIHQENQDAYNALNRCFREAKGSWFAILNSDDTFHPERLQTLMDAQERLGVECLFTDTALMDADSSPITDPGHFWHQWHEGNKRAALASDDLYAGFLHGNFMVSTSNLFLSRKAQEKVGFFSPLRYLHDYDYIFRVLLAFPDGVHFLSDQKLWNYRLHGGNTLKEGAIKARKEDQQVIRSYLLEGIPESSRLRVGTGADRLAALERELADLEHSPVEALRSHGLTQRILGWIRR